MKFLASFVLLAFLLLTPALSFAQEAARAPDYAYAQKMFRYYGSADNSLSFQQAFENKSIIGYHIPVKSLSQEETVINKYSRLGKSSTKRSNPSTSQYYNNSEVSLAKGPLSLNQYMDGRAGVGSAGVRRTYNAQDSQYSLALSPDQIKRKRAAIQRAREQDEKQAQRDQINKTNRARLKSRAKTISPYTPTNSTTQRNTTQRSSNVNVKVYDRNKNTTKPLQRVYDYGSR